MGFNSTMVILNDALHQIKEDKEFGAKVYDAVTRMHGNKNPIDISAGFFTNAATVIESHHADMLKLIAVGGNYGQDLGYCGFHNYTPEQMLKDMAKQMGYRLVKVKK